MAKPVATVATIGEPNFVAWDNARYADTGAKVTGASGTWVVTDQDGNSLGTGDIEPSVGDGNYKATLPVSVTGAMIDGSEYTLTMTLTVASQVVGYRRIRLVATWHGRGC